MGFIHCRKVVDIISNANASTNIPTGTWLQLTSALPYGAAGLRAFNSGAAPVQLAVGAAGSEVAFCIVGTNESFIVPHELKKGARISAQVVGASANATGFLTLNFLG